MFTSLKHYLLTKYRHFHDRKQLEAWQHRQVDRHLDYVREKSPFYRELYSGLKAGEWKSFPLIDKQKMMERFDELNTVGITKEEAFKIALEAEKSRNFSPQIRGITVGLSSGTSGNRGLFLVSPREQMEWAGTLLAKVLPASPLKKQHAALFMRANSNLYETARAGRVSFQFYDLLQPLERHLEKLKTTPPSILVAPPSMLRLLSKADIAPQKIISIAEVLDPLDETFIQEAFGQKVHQIYQCTEGFLGITCSHGTLHLNEDIAVIQKEYIDKSAGKFVPIITDFRRSSQPIIRYRLNDVLTERKEPCPCGSCFTALEKIEGRCDDIFHLQSLEDPNELIRLFPDYIRNAIADTSRDIEEFMVVQRNLNLIEIRLKTSNKNLEPLVKASFQKLCLLMKCQMPKLVFLPYAKEAADKKLRRVRSEYVVR